MKTCTKCLVTKPINEFYKRNGNPIAACKLCTISSTKQYTRKIGKYKGNYGTSRFDKLIGQKINDWVVMGPNIIKGKSAKVLCKCKCGIEQLVICSRLENKKSIGCRNCYPVNGAKSHLFRGIGEISITYLKNIVENANVRDLQIEVTGDELWQLYVDQNKKCALTGLNIDFGKHIQHGKTKIQSQTASLDRIDSTKGYVKGNLQWVHKHVNIMKNKYDNVYFKQICKLVVENDNKV